MGFIKIYNNGTVERIGIDQPLGTLIAVRHEMVAIKVPGHSYWASRGEQGYAGAEIQLYKILERNPEFPGRYKVEDIMDIPIRSNRDPELLRILLESYSDEIIPTK